MRTFYIVGYAIVFILSWKSILYRISAFIYDFTTAMRRKDWRFIFWLLVGNGLALFFYLGFYYLIMRFIGWVIGI